MPKFPVNYMSKALFSLPDVLDRARRELADVDFDTIVGTGFSGGIVIPALALSMGKKFVLIRKDGDDSHHRNGRLVGELGERWIFVDDFILSGRTRTRVIGKISEALVETGSKTTFVGQYMYENEVGFEDFRPSWTEEF